MSLFQFVKACRSGDFALYCETLDLLMPFVAVMDHLHYARNLPVHLRDMASLKACHPALFNEFSCGRFVGQKTRRFFSMLPLDQMHEQLNDWLKNESGTIGNLDDPATVRREQVARPEMARLVQELEGGVDMTTKHHEQYLQFQKSFKVRHLQSPYIGS